MVMTFYELNVGGNETEMKRANITFSAVIYIILQTSICPAHICAGIVIVIAWPKAFRNKLSGSWTFPAPDCC